MRGKWIQCGIFFVGILFLAWAIGPWRTDVSSASCPFVAVDAEREILTDFKHEMAAYRLMAAQAQVDFLEDVTTAFDSTDRECVERHLLSLDARDRGAVSAAVLGYRACMHRFILEMIESRRAQSDDSTDP